jgi:hypothetical protein
MLKQDTANKTKQKILEGEEILSPEVEIIF